MNEYRHLLNKRDYVDKQIIELQIKRADIAGRMQELCEHSLVEQEERENYRDEDSSPFAPQYVYRCNDCELSIAGESNELARLYQAQQRRPRKRSDAWE